MSLTTPKRSHYDRSLERLIRSPSTTSVTSVLYDDKLESTKNTPSLSSTTPKQLQNDRTFGRLMRSGSRTSLFNDNASPTTQETLMTPPYSLRYSKPGLNDVTPVKETNFSTPKSSRINLCSKKTKNSGTFV